MKKMFLLLTFMILATSTLTAQDQDKYHDQDQDRIMAVDGDILLIKDHTPLPLQGRLSLIDGTIVSPNGTYQRKDLKKLHLHDGECLDNDGIKYINDYQYRFKVEQENKGLSQTKIEKRNQNRFQLMLIDGEMFKIMNHSQNRLQEKINLGNGTVVNPNGTCRTPDHIQFSLLDGECLNMDGEIFHNTCVHQNMFVEKKTKKNEVKKEDK